MSNEQLPGCRLKTFLAQQNKIKEESRMPQPSAVSARKIKFRRQMSIFFLKEAWWRRMPSPPACCNCACGTTKTPKLELLARAE